MAEMNVSMSLTLADAASGPLRAFAEGLAQLKATSVGVSKNLESIAAGITGVSKAAASATNVGAFAASLGTLSEAMSSVRAASAGVAAAVGNIGARASAAGIGTYSLEQAMGALGGTLSGIVERLTATAAGLTAVGAEARAAGAGVVAGTAAMGAGLQGANTHASTLMTTLKGLGQLYAAMKIEKGLVGSAEGAIEYQNTQTRLTNMNVSPDERQALIGAANSTSRTVPQFDRNQSLEMGIDLRNATGSVAHAIEMLTPFAVAAYDMKMATPAGQTFNDRDMLLIAKSLEQRNATMDPTKMQSELDMITKIYAATQGRVDAQQILGNLQYSKGGLGQSMDIGFLPMLAAMIEQIKSGGGNGGQIGTALTSLQQSVLNGTGNGQAQKERARLGLIDPDGLVWNKQGNVDQQKSNLRMAGADDFQHNPYTWVQEYLKPAMIRAGIDLADDAAVNQTLNKLFPNRNAANIAATMVNRGSLLEKDAANINQTANGAEQYQNNIKTAQGNIDAFKAQMRDLGIVLGDTLLPAITLVAKGFTSAFEWLSDFFSSHPIAAQIATWGLAFTAVGLAIAGFAAVFMAAGLPTLFAAVGAAVAGAAGFISAALAPALLSLSPILLAIGALVGTFILAWQFGAALGNIQIFGQSVTTWATDLIEWLVGAFRSGWQTIGNIVMSIIPGAQAAEQVGAAGPAARQTARPIDYGAGDGWDAKPKANPFGAIDFGNGGDWGAKSKLFAPSSPPAGGRVRQSKYNEGADVAGNQFKQEEDGLRANLKEIDALQRQGLISIEDFYTAKQAALEVGIGAELAALNKEKAAFDAKGNKAGSNRVQTQIEAAQNRLQTGTDENDANKARDLQGLEQKLADFRRAEFQAAGERHQAELLRIQQRLDKEGEILKLNGLVTQSEIDAAKARAVAASDYGFQQEKIAALQEEEKRREEDLRAAVSNGTLTTTAGDDQIYALRQQLAAQLDELIAKQKALADASGDPKLQRNAEDLGASNDRTKNTLPNGSIELNRGVQSSFESLFKNITNGSMTAGQAFKKFGASILDTFTNIISKRMGDELYASLFGAGGASGALSGGSAGSGGGGGGGLLGSLFGMFGGSGGSGASPVVDSGSVNLFADAAVASFDVGTDYVPHDMLAMIHEGEKITPAAYNKPGKDGGAMTVHNHFTVSGSVDSRSQSQIAAAAGMGVQRAVARAR